MAQRSFYLVCIWFDDVYAPPLTAGTLLLGFLRRFLFPSARSPAAASPCRGPPASCCSLPAGGAAGAGALAGGGSLLATARAACCCSGAWAAFAGWAAGVGWGSGDRFAWSCGACFSAACSAFAAAARLACPGGAGGVMSATTGSWLGRGGTTAFAGAACAGAVFSPASSSQAAFMIELCR